MFDNLGLNPQQQAIAEKIASYGFAAGMTEAGVAAMVTAAIHESALNPTLSHPDAPPGSAQQFNSNGLFQMNRDRWANQVEFMQRNGLDPWSADGQIQAFINEITSPPKPGISNYQKIAEPLFSTNDPAKASTAFSKIEGHATLRDAQGLTEADRRAQTATGIYKDDYGNLVGAKYEIQGPPASAEAAKAPGIGLQSASMGGLMGPITAAQADPIPSTASFFGEIGKAALAQTGQPFGAINMGTTAGFNRPGTSYGMVGTPTVPSLFNDQLSPTVSSYAPVDAPPSAPALPAAQGAQLPGLDGMPPAGKFGAMPLGNYSMASVPAPAPQPSANVSISALAGPAPSLSLSGKAVADPLAALAGLPSDAELASRIPAPGTAQPYAAPTPAAGTPLGPSPAPTPAAATPFSAPASPAAAPTFGSLPAEVAGLQTPDFPAPGTVSYSPQTPAAPVEAAPKVGPVSIDGAPLAGMNPAVGGFGAMPAGPANISMATPTITTAAAPPVNTPTAPAPSAPALTADPRPDALTTGMGTQPSMGAAFGSLPAGPAIPGATTAADIQQGLAGLPAPVDLPSTPPSTGASVPAAGIPGASTAVEIQQALAELNGQKPAFGGLPTVGQDMLNPALTPQEAIPTVKAPDTPAPPAAPGGPINGMPSPVVSAPAVTRSVSAPPPSTPVSGSVVTTPQAPQQPPQTPQAAPSFGALAGVGVQQQGPSQSAQGAYGVMPTGQWNWATTTLPYDSNMTSSGSWVPAGYEYSPSIEQVAATGSGPFGALGSAFGGSSFGYDYNNGLY